MFPLMTLSFDANCSFLKRNANAVTSSRSIEHSIFERCADNLAKFRFRFNRSLRANKMSLFQYNITI